MLWECKGKDTMIIILKKNWFLSDFLVISKKAK